jgi:hypothetical protein
LASYASDRLPPTLAVRIDGLSVADVLGLVTVYIPTSA